MYTGLEPVISAVTGRHPNQLNEYTYLRLKRTPVHKLPDCLSLPTQKAFVAYNKRRRPSVYALCAECLSIIHSNTQRLPLSTRLTTYILLGGIRNFVAHRGIEPLFSE